MKRGSGPRCGEVTFLPPDSRTDPTSGAQARNHKQPPENHQSIVPPEEEPESAIGSAISNLRYDPSELLRHDLAWQQDVGGETTKLKAFQNKAMKQQELVVLAYMKPNSPFLHYLHLAEMFYAVAILTFMQRRSVSLGMEQSSKTPLLSSLPHHNDQK